MEYTCLTPVLLIFFNRPDTFAKVFEKVRKAKPKTLILAQDGPRDDKDLAGINACRRIAENVDWACDIIYDYSQENLGCGVRPQSAITNALNKFEQIIILEDDCVPSDSFFQYCDEMLEKYKDDERISYISGLNHFETWDCGENSYFFAKTGAIWGWATWKRAWAFYDYGVELVNDAYLQKTIKGQVNDRYVADAKLNAWKQVNKLTKEQVKLSYWDVQWGLVKYSQNQVVIVPKYNQICNIGIGETSTHAQKTKKAQFKKNVSYFFIPTHTLQFPLVHPRYCYPDVYYDKKVNKNLNHHKIFRKLKKLFPIKTHK